MRRNTTLSKTSLPALAAALILGAAGTLGALVATEARADCGHDHGAAQPSAAATETEQLSPEMQAAMEAWQRSMAPAEAHGVLKTLAGNWTTKTTWSMEPGAAPTTSMGRSEHRLVLGGRYLEQVYRGEFMGMPFEGLGYTGYDNVQGRYVGTWMDNMGTGMMSSVGDATPDGKTLTFHGEYWDPATGRPSLVREVVRIESPDRHVMEMYGRDPKTHEEWKSMVIVFTRESTAAGQ